MSIDKLLNAWILSIMICYWWALTRWSWPVSNGRMHRLHVVRNKKKIQSTLEASEQEHCLLRPSGCNIPLSIADGNNSHWGLFIFPKRNSYMRYTMVGMCVISNLVHERGYIVCTKLHKYKCQSTLSVSQLNAPRVFNVAHFVNMIRWLDDSIIRVSNPSTCAWRNFRSFLATQSRPRLRVFLVLYR
jgi:hypothetical protein